MNPKELDELAEALAERIAAKSAMAAASPWVDTRQAAAYLGVSTQFLEGARHYEDGKGPAFHRVGRLVRYHVRDLDAWLAAGRERGDGR